MQLFFYLMARPPILNRWHSSDESIWLLCRWVLVLVVALGWGISTKAPAQPRRTSIFIVIKASIVIKANGEAHILVHYQMDTYLSRYAWVLMLMVAIFTQATVSGSFSSGSRVAARQMRHGWKIIGLVCYFCVFCFILFPDFIFHSTCVADHRWRNADWCGSRMPMWHWGWDESGGIVLAEVREIGVQWQVIFPRMLHVRMILKRVRPFTCGGWHGEAS